MVRKSEGKKKPVVLMTGASGKVGTALCKALRPGYTVVGLDIKPCEGADESHECDLTSDDSIRRVLDEVRRNHGKNIAAVIHLAAYYDFSGKDVSQYQKVNIDGTRSLVKALRTFKVERFIYSSTMLVHKPGVPGQKIDEDTPIEPGWAYPHSKAAAEKVIEEEAVDMPFTILRLAGVYDDHTAVPTLSYQIARIYEREFKSFVYSGDMMAGQAFLHNDDMIDLFTRVVDRRHDLPERDYILAGEESVMGYKELQNRIGNLIFGAPEWATFDIPEFIAKPGAWLENKAEPVIPDAIDQGEKPFIKPFMIDLASDHYEIDISRAQESLDWQPQHHIYDGLAELVESLKDDPARWYKENGITAPDWVQVAEEKHTNADKMRTKHEKEFRKQHYSNLWAHFLNMGLALWLIFSPFTLGYESTAMVWSDIASGVVLMVLAFMSLSPRFCIARWGCAAVGFWLLSAPLIFWAPTAAAYMNGTLVGMLVMGFAVLVRPLPGVAAAAAQTGPTIPKGWEFSPSSWFQRMPIIILAFVGFVISRYMTAYQLGHIDAVWDPFFNGAANDPKNGTEEIITSSVSEAWPVPDAGLGAMTYALEILTGLIGSSRRWRTIPWLVTLFGVMIVPLGIISIFFIIIQPIWLGTWCTLCLIAAAAMLIQIPYSFDELVATGAFLWRRKKQGRSFLRVFFLGDTDDGKWEEVEDDFAQKPRAIIRDMLTGGITLPWNLVACIVVGVWLMFTRLTVGAEGGMADMDHLIGALAVTMAITATAETARILRFTIVPMGLALAVAPFVVGAGMAATISAVLCGVLLMILPIRRGPVYNSYGGWDKTIR